MKPFLASPRKSWSVFRVVRTRADLGRGAASSRYTENVTWVPPTFNLALLRENLRVRAGDRKPGKSEPARISGFSVQKRILGKDPEFLLFGPFSLFFPSHIISISTLDMGFRFRLKKPGNLDFCEALFPLAFWAREDVGCCDVFRGRAFFGSSLKTSQHHIITND